MIGRLLPVVAVAVAVAVVGAVLASAGPTLGYDARAYLDAARRLLEGQVIYDTSIDQAGAAGLFYYSPPFTLLAVPFALLPAPLDVAGWIAALLAAFLAGVAILPVSRRVRWLIVLLAGLSWPFAYAVKLGQVGPILFLCFAVGWRWMDRPVRLGAAAAIGTIVKLQPGILFVWAILTRRWAAVGVGLVVLAGAAVVATLVCGVDAWAAWLTILRSISDPITTPHNFTPGAVAYRAGLGEGPATALQVVDTVVVLAVVLWAAVRTSPTVGYLTAATASQLLSPVLWDHYAMLLLLPTAWLLDRGRWWAAAIPLATSIVLIWLPPVVYPVAFWVALLAPIAIGDVPDGRLRAQR
ncbi:MAG: glycosyltransferase family 87 protein, partial [Candidatus Limnocylindrales bacterium]